MLKGSQQREELDVTQVFTGSFWLLVGKSWVGGLEWELGGGEEAPTVVQTKNRQVDRMGWAMGTGKWVDSVYSLKMELTEFFEELGVRCEDKTHLGCVEDSWPRDACVLANVLFRETQNICFSQQMPYLTLNSPHSLKRKYLHGQLSL